MSLASCGGDGGDSSTSDPLKNAGPLGGDISSCLAAQGYEVNSGPLNAKSRQSGTEGVLSVFVGSDPSDQADVVMDVYAWESPAKAAAYIKDVGAGPLNELKHEQVGTITITYENTTAPGDVSAVAGCMA